MRKTGAANFTATGSMTTARQSYTATLLGNGKVLIVGGLDNDGNTLASAELHDPAAGTSTATGSMTAARIEHTATLLGNEMVLIAGGGDAGGDLVASAELYDPSAGTFTATGMASPRDAHTATLLCSGKVLIAGGHWANDRVSSNLASAELYDPTAGTFTATRDMTAMRVGHTATLLPNGKVLIAGGDDGDNALASAELYEE